MGENRFNWSYLINGVLGVLIIGAVVAGLWIFIPKNQAAVNTASTEQAQKYYIVEVSCKSMDVVTAVYQKWMGNNDLLKMMGYDPDKGFKPNSWVYIYPCVTVGIPNPVDNGVPQHLAPFGDGELHWIIVADSKGLVNIDWEKPFKDAGIDLTSVDNARAHNTLTPADFLGYKVYKLYPSQTVKTNPVLSFVCAERYNPLIKLWEWVCANN